MIQPGESKQVGEYVKEQKTKTKNEDWNVCYIFVDVQEHGFPEQQEDV